MKSKILRWLAMVLIIETGVLHYIPAQEQYYKAAYLGYLAVAVFIIALFAALGIYFQKFFGWLSGLLLAVGSIAGFVLTRTIALPGLAIETWIYPYGIIGSVVEGLFIILFFVAQPWKAIPAGEGIQPASRCTRFLLPITGLILIAGSSYGAYDWDLYASETGYHVHVGSLEAVCSSKITTMDEFEQEYGLRITLIATTAMDSIVDVRLKIIDPDKAEKLLANQAALLVNQETLILAPHLHTHWKLKKDKVHVMFFPTQNNTIRTGSEVSLVVGNVRVEPVIVK